MNDDDVFQIIHRGQEVKVIMTQEHFFALMERIEKPTGEKLTPHDPAKLVADFEAKMNQVNDLLKKTEK